MRSRNGRAGDFQLSLGLIVTVVFAVVLLSLAVLWIQGVFPGLTGLTDDLVQDARAKIRETFSTSNQNFAIWPNQHTLKPGASLRMLAGIKNNAGDGKDHQFAVNVIPIGASTCAEGDAACLDAVRGWLTFDKTTGLVLIRDIGEKTVTITVPQNAVQGTYLFNVVVCADFIQSTGAAVGPPDSASCVSTSQNLFSSAKPLNIIVTG
ncbi:MAG TPA: hypothetical protein VJB16_06820 [archaeon]|nr:hypothetical protein [archaeon]